MKVVFMGTGDIAMPSFLALIESRFELVALVTQPDKPVGRKQVLTAPAIKVLAEKEGVEVLQPEKLRDIDALAQLEALDADVFVVMAYGQILSTALLQMPKKACINLHASLLPKHRGASCIQTAIAEGDAETGVTVMHMVEGLDEGDVILKHSMRIGENETGGELHDRLAESAPMAMLEALSLIESGEDTRDPQDDSKSNYAGKLLRKHGEIDWKLPAEQLERLIRAYDPWPGNFTTFTDAKGRTKRLKLFPQTKVVEGDSGVPGEVIETEGRLVIRCGVGALEITRVQPEGSKQMGVSAFLQSGVLKLADQLGI